MDDEVRRPFYRYSTYLRNTYGLPAYRVGVDGGFSCPNRASDLTGGCSYCDGMGASAVYHRAEEQQAARERRVGHGLVRDHQSLPDANVRGKASEEALRSRERSIAAQVGRGVAYLRRRYQAEVFLLYFQAYSNTYAEPATLRRLYDTGLAQHEFRELIIATRPDCIDPERSDLISSYRGEVDDVWVELGLQSAKDHTLESIGRGHTVDRFREAFTLLRERGVKIAVHLILGLPGEGYKEIVETARLITEIRPEAVKIHNLHIPVGTALYRAFESGETTAPSMERHLSSVTELLERIPSDTIIQRVTCDTPAHRLAAPGRFGSKGEFIAQLERTMQERGLWQGRLSGEKCSPRSSSPPDPEGVSAWQQ